MAEKTYGDAAARQLSIELPAEFKCRAVATSIGAYTTSGGVLTVTANGALAAQDGVTMAAGDLLFVQEGLTNVTAADAGPYVISSLGSASAQVVLVRPAWWKHGALVVAGAVIQIAAGGTLFGGTEWKSFVTTATKVVGTDAPVFWPRSVSKSATLVSGTITAVTTVPIRSATLSTYEISSTPTTAPHASTRVWRVDALTAGVTGTASYTIVAESAPGTTNASDVGTYVVRWINW